MMRLDSLVSHLQRLMPLFFFLNVYLPYQCDDNIDEYLAMLGNIRTICDSFESTNIFIIGDCNANISKPSPFSPHLNAFIIKGTLA